MNKFGIELRGNLAIDEISVFVGENIRSNTQSAFRKALDLIDSGVHKKVLIVNTTTGQRWALKCAREIDAERIGDEFSKPVCCMGVIAGDLCSQMSSVEQMVERHGFDLIIINSWEFASRSPRHKDSLMFGLREMMEKLGITVLIYSHQTQVGNHNMGQITRTLGKLSAIAAYIVTVEEDEAGEWKAEAEFTDDGELVETSDYFVGADGLASGTEDSFAPYKDGMDVEREYGIAA